MSNSNTITLPLPRRHHLLLAAGGAALAFGAWTVTARVAAHAALAETAQSAAIADVIATTPQPGPATEDVVLPGEVKGDNETTLYARTSGYITRWTADIGASVQQGQTLAVIASPELDQQVRQAEADLRTARARAAVAQTTARRVAGLVSSQAVSVQENEDRSAAAIATNAEVAASEANLARLRQLQGFERIVAPFSGTITARRIDIGSLITAGDTQGTELFRISRTGRLRTYVDVPQSYAAQIRASTPAELDFPDRPGQHWPAQVTRTALAIDPASRTLRVELDIDNAGHALFPGSFTEVRFHLAPAGHGLRLPANALLFRAEGTRVAVVGPDRRAHLRAITLGRDFGTAVEVLTGLAPTDRVIVNPAAALEEGDPVRLVALHHQPAGA